MAQRPPHPLANKHIIVAGAGMAGLAFAVSLHKQWPSASSLAPPRITIYERDPCAVPPNREGYSLSLRSDAPSAGIQTLQKMGLLDLLTERSIAVVGAETMDPAESAGGFCVWRVEDKEKDGEGEKKWARVLKVASKTPPNVLVAGLRIARAELRRTLVEAVEQLPNVKLVWGATITDLSSSSSSQVCISLATGTTDTADLLVAADGAASKLRTLLRPNDTLRFAGPTCVYALAPIKDLHPSGRTTEFGSVISGAGRGLFLAPIDKENMVWCLSWHTASPPIPHRAPLSPDDRAAVLAETRRQGSAVFGARFERVLQATQPESLTQFNAMDKPAFAHAPGYIQDPARSGLEPRVVFLGDANHAVSPFAGNGANLALMDGWAMAECLVGTEAETGTGMGEEGGFEEYLAPAVGRYDKIAVGRARKVVAISHFSIQVMHSGAWMSRFWFMFLKVVQWLLFRKVE